MAGQCTLHLYPKGTILQIESQLVSSLKACWNLFIWGSRSPNTTTSEYPQTALKPSRFENYKPALMAGIDAAAVKYAKEADLVEIIDAYDMKSLKNYYRSYELVRSLQMMLPWSSDETNVMTRRALYTRVIMDSSRGNLEVEVNLQKPNSRMHPTYIDASAFEGPYNPLGFLRLLQPHFSNEINSFYYSSYTFLVWGLGKAAKWLESIPLTTRSSIRRLRVIMWYSKHQNHGRRHRLQRVLQAMSLCPPASPLTEEIEISSTKTISGNGTEGQRMGLHNDSIKIKLPTGSKIYLDIVDHDPAHGPEILRFIKSAVQEPETRSIGDAVKAIAKPCEGINFFQILPFEIRSMILRYVFYADRSSLGSDATDLHQWSGAFHCKYSWRVSRQFVQEIRHLFYSQTPFVFTINDEEYYERTPPYLRGQHAIESFVRLAGPEMLACISYLEIRLDHMIDSDIYEPFDDWFVRLRWLVELLNELSLTPKAPRNVSSAVLQCTSIRKLENQGASKYTGFKTSFKVRVKLANENVKVIASLPSCPYAKLIGLSRLFCPSESFRIVAKSSCHWQSAYSNRSSLHPMCKPHSLSSCKATMSIDPSTSGGRVASKGSGKNGTYPLIGRNGKALGCYLRNVGDKD